MLTRNVALLVAMALVGSAWAQSASTLPAENATYVGEVSGTNVNVRSGPGNTAYPCAKLSYPAKVTVVGKTAGNGFNWLKILPPPGCFSAVLKKDVQLDADGKTGVVQGNVFPRAGGDERQRDFWAIQSPGLNKGDKVQIIGDAGEYYKIAPPQGAVFYISDQYVKTPGSAEAVVSTTVRRTPASRPATPTVSTSEVQVTSVPPTSAADSDTAAKAYEEAEKSLMGEYKKPADQRDLQAVLAKYKAINADEALKPYIEYRVKFLEMELQLQREKQSADQLVKDAARKTAEAELERGNIVAATVNPNVPKAYDAEGYLAVSVLFPGGATGPKKYAVKDPQTSRITAYVQCTTGAVNLDLYVNKYVAISGKSTFDKDLQRYVVDAQDIRELKTSIEMPAAPKPVMKVDDSKLPAATQLPRTAVPPAPAPLGVKAPPVEPKPVAPVAEPRPAPASAPAKAATSAPAKDESSAVPDFDLGSDSSVSSKALPAGATTKPVNPDEYK